MLKQALLNSALVSSVERNLRRSRNPKILKRSSKLLQRSSLMLRRFSDRLLQTRHVLQTVRRNESFNEDRSDSEVSDDSDFEEDDSDRNYMERAFYGQGQEIGETFYPSDDSEDSEDSEDEAMLEMEIELLEEDLKRMGKFFEVHGKTMSENERRDFKHKYRKKKMQLGALEEMLETRHMMEEEEEMKRNQEEMKMLEEDLKRIEQIFETNSKAMSENEIQDLEENYLMKKRQLMELEEELAIKMGRVGETFGNLGEMGQMEEMDERERMEYNMNSMDGVGGRERSDLEQPVDLLQKHIGDHDLGLVFRPPTRDDGNCWYDAVADQISLLDLPGFPRDHRSVRALVVSAIPQLPQAEGWVENLFGGDKKLFSRFLQRHSENQAWTDGYGIICQATALVLGREIQVIGTNHKERGGLITLESVAGSADLPPLTIGHYYEQHYQSLARGDLVVKVDPEEKTRPDSGFEEDLKEENLKREEEEDLRREEEEDLRREEENQMIKLTMGPNPSCPGNTRFTFEDERNGNEMVKTNVKRSQG